MTDFGDFDEDDAYDPSPADPEQVARKLHDLRLDAGLEDVVWTALADDERAIRIELLGILLRWLRRQGSLR